VIAAAHPSVLFLGYDLEAPSFRYRMRSLIEPLRARGWTASAEKFPNGRYLLRTWERRETLGAADVVVLSKIKLSRPEAALLARFARQRVFDFDDAIYVRKPRQLGEAPHDSAWRRHKFLATSRSMTLIVPGNRVLADAARPAGVPMVVMPTPVNVEDYGPPRTNPAAPPVIVWIGRPENLVYLELVRPALSQLMRRTPCPRLRIVCSAFPDWPEIEIERVPWSPDSEVPALLSADIGIMPLTDDEWSRGKCAFKLLQYMAASLPCVASPVGANVEAVVDGETGFLAATTTDWERALTRLLDSRELRARLGAAGRRHAEARYSMRAYVAGYCQLLEDLISAARRGAPARAASR
jgi:glycosyltransferase involved in cell wall biosynthesis